MIYRYIVLHYMKFIYCHRYTLHRKTFLVYEFSFPFFQNSSPGGEDSDDGAAVLDEVAGGEGSDAAERDSLGDVETNPGLGFTGYGTT